MKFKPEFHEPVLSNYVTSDFGERILNGGKQFHDGIDFVNFDPTSKKYHTDKSVFAIADGIISFDYDIYDERFRWLRPQDSVGNMVILRIKIAGQDYCFRYCHLGINIVSVNQFVKRGQKLGEYADVGQSYGPHLHGDLSIGTVFDRTKKLDPKTLLC